MTSCCTAAKSNTEKANGIQNRAMHSMTGAMRSTPISALETATGPQCLEDRSSIKVLTQTAKFIRLTDHPMHSWRSKPRKGRLKSSTFIHYSCILEKQQPELLDHMPGPCRNDSSSQQSTRASQVSKEKQPSQILREDPFPCSTLVPTTQRRSGHMSALMDLPLKLPGIEMEGSTSNTEQKKSTFRWRLDHGRYATNFKAKAMTLNTTATEIQANLDKYHKKKIVFFSDALSVLDALQPPPPPPTPPK